MKKIIRTASIVAVALAVVGVGGHVAVKATANSAPVRVATCTSCHS
jgi:hypothetical protein